MSQQPVAEIINNLKNFIFLTFPRAKQNNIGIEDHLLDSGAVESLGLLTLIDYIETEFDLSISGDDMSEDNFGTITAIANYIVKKAS